MSRWQRYWFAEGGRLSAAILRIAIAIAVWLTLDRLREGWGGTAPGGPVWSGVYRPVGIWMLFGHHIPSEGVIDALWMIARIATIGMLLGAVTRVSTALTFAAGVALAALSYSGTQTWSHQYNVVFIALCAFLGARGGDTLSVDALVRNARGLPPLDVPRGYQWSIRLVQLAVAMMFVSGMFHKLLHGHMTLRWALSDNLRHHLLVRYDLTGIPRPEIVNWILEESWRYQGTALLNLISQLLPLGAVFLVRRPWLRAACGAFFVIETFALGVVVELWNLHWLPLAAVFVDWEALSARVIRRGTPPPAPTGWRPPRAARTFVIVFVVYDVILGLVPRLDQVLNTYPFSGFPMFATIRARQPYSEHLPYSVVGGHIELVTTEPIAEGTYRWLDYKYRWTYLVGDPGELGKRLAGIFADAHGRYEAVRAVRLHLAVFEAPAYPAPAKFERRQIALIGEYHLDGTFRTMLGRVREDGADVTVESRVYFREDSSDPIPGPLTNVGSGTVYSVANVREGSATQPWLVGTRRESW